MDSTNMSLNDIATIRNILVGKEMRDKETEFQTYQAKMTEELQAIRTAIDQLNQKIESFKQQTDEHFEQLETQVQREQENIQTQFSDKSQQQHREIAEAFAHLSTAFGKFSAEVVHANGTNDQD
ncbi:MAG: hypothetical protein AAGI23_06440 [Bacteroidota bacterium]